MAEASARSLLIDLVVRATNADRELKKIEQAAAGIDGKLNSAAKALKAFAGGAAAGAAIAAIGQGFRTMADSIKSSIDSMDEMGKAAQKVGVTVSALSELNYVAGQSGVSFDTLQTGLKKLATNLSEVDKGTSGAAKALKTLGVTGADSPQVAIKKLADAFASAPDGITKTALASELFGQKIGAELIPLLNQGSAEITRLEERARFLGVSLGDDAAKKAAQFNDNLDDMRLAMQGIVNNITVGMLPALVNLSNEIVGSARDASAWQDVGKVLGEQMAWMAGKVYYAANAFKAQALAFTVYKQAIGLALKGEFSQAVLVIQNFNDNIIEMDRRTREVMSRLDAPFTGVAAAATKAERPAANLGAALAAAGKKGKEGAEKVSDFDRAIQAMREEVFLLTRPGGDGSLTELDRLQARIASGAIKVSEAEAQQLITTRRYIEEMRLAASGTLTLSEQIEQQIDIKNRQARAFLATAEAAKKASEAAELAAFNQSNDPFAQFLATSEQIDRMQALGASTTALAAARKKMWEDWERSVGKVKEEDDMYKSLKDAIDGYGKAMAGSFVDAIASGKSFKESFKQITADILKNMAKMILQKTIFDKLFGAFGGGGFNFGELFGPIRLAKGGAFSSSTGLPFGVYNSPTFFQMPGSGPLQKFARGGVLGEAGPEAIMPLKRGQDGKLGVEGGAVTVNVINNAGAAVSVQRDGDDINIIIERVRSALTKDVRSGGNAFAGALQNTYGLNRAYG